jgi:phage tail tape-measure protein
MIDYSAMAPPGLPDKILRRLARHPILVISVASMGLRVGREAKRFKSGEIDGPEFRARTASHLGSISGGAIGATAGAIAGSVLPGLGSIIGGFAGGILGEAGGSKLLRFAAEKLEEKIGEPEAAAPKRPRRDL